MQLTRSWMTVRITLQDANIHTKPPLVSPDTTVRSILLALLEGSSLGNLSVSIPNGLASVEKLLLASTGSVDVEVLSCRRQRAIVQSSSMLELS